MQSIILPFNRKLKEAAMKIGLSTYSLEPLLRSGEFTLEKTIDWAASNGAEVLELVPFTCRFDDPVTEKINTAFIRLVRRRAADAGIELSNYSVLANLLNEGEEQEKEISRVCHEIDIAAELGIPRMRHDISSFRRPHNESTLADFDRLLPRMIDAASRISEYAKTRNVMTLLENHGFFVNGCDRVERLMGGVKTGNYGLLLDTGNFICVDEDPHAAAVRLAAQCRMIHLKNFYIRQRDPGDSTRFDCAGRWFRSRGGKYLRGSILGQGDLDVHSIIRALKRSGYDGPVAVEFEGMEEPKYASAVSIMNARRMLEEA